MLQTGCYVFAVTGAGALNLFQRFFMFLNAGGFPERFPPENRIAAFVHADTLPQSIKQCNGRQPIKTSRQMVQVPA